jgi:hypothetical protein
VCVEKYWLTISFVKVQNFDKAKSTTLPPMLLTSVDYFLLALERHDTYAGTSGNTCRYVLELDGMLDAITFERKLNEDESLLWLASLRLRTGLFRVPWWEQGEVRPLKVGEYESDELLPVEILAHKMSLSEGRLMAFDVVKRSSGACALVFSWHHLLMDGYGASLLLSQLAAGMVDKHTLVASQKKVSNRLVQRKAVRLFFQNMKLFFTPVSQKAADSMLERFEPGVVEQNIRVLRFTKEETAELHLKAAKLGVRFGKSAFYLACSAQSVKVFLENKGRNIKHFWIPVPQDQRKKQAKGPLLGNHLSFLFYSLKAASLSSLATCTKEVERQMLEQMKMQSPEVYHQLMSWMSRLPMWIYYRFVKGPQGGSLTSFLFTVAAEHPKDLLHFQGLRVKNALSFPPNVYPPGLTFAFMPFENQLQVMVMSYANVLSEADMLFLENKMRHELLSLQD